MLAESTTDSSQSEGGGSDDDPPPDDEMRLLLPTKSNREINMAAKRLVGWEYPSDDEMDADFGTIAEFRASHAYPLRAVTTILRRKAQLVDPSATVYGRTKRMISIIMKLQRYPAMQATTMQDMGGCRAVVKDMVAVAKLTQQFREIAVNLEEPREYNYITNPKSDGYRSVHFVVRYRPKVKAYLDFPTRRIEIQIRSALQHKWANALETIDLFTRQTLKTGGGQYSWKRFFVLTSSLVAVKEDCPVVADSVSNDEELLEELRGLWKGIRIREQFDGWATASRDYIPQEHGGNSMYLIEVDVDQKKTSVTGFPDAASAYNGYANAERKNRNIAGRTAVLVSALSVNQLRSAFPSYYGDTKAFLDEVEGLIR
jgi:hypothetical protein